MTLVAKQQLFAKLLAELITWIYAQGWAVTLADGSIDSPRLFRDTVTGVTFKAEDAGHKRGGLHYQRLAQDLNLFVGGEWVRHSAHPAWLAIGRQWESMHTLTRWGGNWDRDGNPLEPGEHDGNHVSLFHEGRA